MAKTPCLPTPLPEREEGPGLDRRRISGGHPISSPSAISLIVLLILTTALTLYARWGLGYPICGTDEQNYLKIFAWLDNGGVWPISGPGYATLILELRHWTGWDTRSAVVAVAVFNSSVVLPLGLWALYRVSLNSAGAAWRCLPWLFASSYFLGPWLEGRPQQLGMLLAAAGAWRAWRDLQERGWCGLGFFTLWALCLGYHALSFVVLTVLAFGFWAGRFVHQDSGYRALGALLAGLAGGLALSPLWYPLIWLDIRINHVQGMAVAEFFGALAFLLTTGLLLLHTLRRYGVVLALIRRLQRGLASSWIHGLLAVGAVAVLTWQYAWLGHLYQGRDPGAIIVYQGGNVLLGGLFLRGLWRLSREPVREQRFFVESSVILLVFAGVFLALTPWLRDQNFPLRILNYWTWYAAPLAAWGWAGLPQPWRRGLLIVAPLLLAGGVHHVLQAPTWTCAIEN